MRPWFNAAYLRPFREFQSSSFPTSGCDPVWRGSPSSSRRVSILILPYIRMRRPPAGCRMPPGPCFNPHPSLHQDATRSRSQGGRHRWTSVSILILPYIRMRRPRAAAPISRLGTIEFQSSSFPTSGCDQRDNAPSDNGETSFNPHPSLHQAATLQLQGATASAYTFQSSSFPTSGCDDTAAGHYADKWDVSILILPYIRMRRFKRRPQRASYGCFNPHPSLHQDATGALLRVVGSSMFQSSSFPTSGCDHTEFETVAIPVSILILPYIRMRLAALSAPGITRFNPHPSLHQDATELEDRGTCNWRFNPHPSLHQDATSPTWFSAGHPHLPTRCDRTRLPFQSSSFPTSGCASAPCRSILPLHQERRCRLGWANVSILILPYIRMRRTSLFASPAKGQVSILILPYIRMRHTVAGTIARHTGFNPHPSLHQDATSGVAPAVNCFNPHPSLHQVCVDGQIRTGHALADGLQLSIPHRCPYIRTLTRRLRRGQTLLHLGRYPAVPSLTCHGCDRCRGRGRSRVDAFQSSSVPTSGCDSCARTPGPTLGRVSILVLPYIRMRQ
jgi:hypothetical protein